MQNNWSKIENPKSNEKTSVVTSVESNTLQNENCEKNNKDYAIGYNFEFSEMMEDNIWKACSIWKNDDT